MKRIALWIVAVALAVSASGAAVLGAEPQTLKGSFVWNNENRTGDLEAVFTETEDGMYDVDFRFEWEGKPRVFSGTAVGSLSSGKLDGRVTNDTEEHTHRHAAARALSCYRRRFAWQWYPDPPCASTPSTSSSRARLTSSRHS